MFYIPMICFSLIASLHPFSYLGWLKNHFFMQRWKTRNTLFAPTISWCTYFNLKKIRHADTIPKMIQGMQEDTLFSQISWKHIHYAWALSTFFAKCLKFIVMFVTEYGFKKKCNYGYTSISKYQFVLLFITFSTSFTMRVGQFSRSGRVSKSESGVSRFESGVQNMTINTVSVPHNTPITCFKKAFYMPSFSMSNIWDPNQWFYYIPQLFGEILLQR